MDTKNDLFRAIDEPYLNVFRLVLKQMDKHSNKWHSNAGNHQGIRNRLGIQQSTLEKHLRKLRDKELLLKSDDGRGVYLINKQLVEYGTKA